MLKKLFEGVDGLTDELIARMQPMFEAAVDQKAQSSVTQLKEAHAAELEELRSQLAESAAVNNEERAAIMAEKLDVFLERVVGSWINENSEKVQGVAINEAAAVFLGQLAEAAKSFNAVIPESDQSAVDTLSGQVQRLEARLNDSLRENMSLRESELKTKKLVIAGRVARGMSDMGKERLKEAAMGSTYRDPKQFKTLVESHRLIIEGQKKGKMDEDDLFDDGKEVKSKQKPDGTMGEDYVDGTDKDYPLNIKENKDDDEDDFFDDEDELDEGKKGKKGKKVKNESDDKDDDDEEEDDDDEEEEGDKKDKKVNESVDLSVFSGLLRKR